MSSCSYRATVIGFFIALFIHVIACLFCFVLITLQITDSQNGYTHHCMVFSDSCQFNVHGYQWLKFTLKELRRSVQSFFILWCLQVIINGLLWNGRWDIVRCNATLLFSRHGTNCSSPFYHLEISIILVYSGFAWAGLRGLYLAPNLQRVASVIGAGKRTRLLSHSHAARFARWRCRFDEKSKICFRVDRLERMPESGVIDEYQCI